MASSVGSGGERYLGMFAWTVRTMNTMISSERMMSTRPAAISTGRSPSDQGLPDHPTGPPRIMRARELVDKAVSHVTTLNAAAAAPAIGARGS